MALFIVGSYKASPYDPDSAFDPVTHVATEASFIQLLQHGVYDSKYIGYKVQLGNSVDYNNGLWVIADVNHDSENTGQTDCYDLISENCFHYGVFNSSNNKWRSSNVRTWLNDTFYNGFSSNLKNRLMNPKYKTQSIWYTDDYVIIPSYKEVNGGTSTAQDNEGVAYPIFTDNASRIKYQSGTSTAKGWWIRSRYTSSSGSVWNVNSNGTISYGSGSGSLYLAPLMRVH
jgi:hypothetical protein